MSLDGVSLEPRSSGLVTVALLDAMPDATAVLDTAGTIIAVNRAWRMFSIDNGGTPEATGVGTNYLDVCARSAASGCADATLVAEGLRAVLSRDTVECDLEYPCPSPAVGRWFVLRVTPIAGVQPGVLVSHVNISRRKMAERDLERRATEDPLTGLANRALFSERLGTALIPRPGRSTDPDVGIAYLDLNGFKPVNDTYGHAAGDEVLQTVATRLREVTRPQDCIARLGGDEFAVLATRVNADVLTALAARIQGALARPHKIHGRDVETGASVGTYLATAGEAVAACLHRADQAMYAAKRAHVRVPRQPPR